MVSSDIEAEFERRIREATGWEKGSLFDDCVLAAREIFTEMAEGWRKTPAANEQADEWCRAEDCQYRHWRSGSMPTHKRGNGCPAPVTPDTGQREWVPGDPVYSEPTCLGAEDEPCGVCSDCLQVVSAAQAPAASKGKTIVFGPDDEATICGTRVKGLRLGWALCPLPPGHDGDCVPQAPAASEEPDHWQQCGDPDCACHDDDDPTGDRWADEVAAADRPAASGDTPAHPANGDTIEQAARVIEEATGIVGEAAWTAVTDVHVAEEIAEQLAGAGLLATNQAHDERWPELVEVNLALRARIEKALAPLREFRAGAYETPEEGMALLDSTLAALSGTEDEGNQP